jgi:hypothetical protein
VTDQETDRIIKSTVRETMRETFLLLGVDLDDPKDVREFRSDLVHARKVRRTIDSAGSKAGLTLLVLLVTVLAAATWQGIAAAFGKVIGQ